MEVKIGVQHAARELVVDSGQSADEIEQAVSDALNGKTGVFAISDQQGRRIIVPAERLAYVEIGEPETRRVGFGAL